MSTDYVVGTFTMGQFQEWCTDPLTLDEAREFVADPPEGWVPRVQDSLRIYELVEVDDEAEL